MKKMLRDNFKHKADKRNGIFIQILAVFFERLSTGLLQFGFGMESKKVL